MYIGAVPLKMADGREWKDVKQGYYERFVDLTEAYSPGFRDSILGAKISSPDDFNTDWVHKGSSRAVDLIPSQMGPGDRARRWAATTPRRSRGCGGPGTAPTRCPARPAGRGG